MYKEHLKELIENALKEYDLYSESAVMLLLGTAAQESKFGFYLRQLGGGPARGIFQIEEPTFDWLKGKYAEKYGLEGVEFGDLIWNLKAAAVFCRLRYLVDSLPLPASTDIPGMARYWKRVYNTHLGAGTAAEFILNYNKYVRGI